VKEQSNDVLRIPVSKNLVDERDDRGIVQNAALHRLSAKLCKLAHKELLGRWKLRLPELEFSEFLEVVEIRDIQRGNEAYHLLGLTVGTARNTVEVNLRITRHRVVNYDIKVLERNAACCNIRKNKRCDFLLLDRNNRLTELYLWHVSDELLRGYAALL
jgi:hypothetical protein